MHILKSIILSAVLALSLTGCGAMQLLTGIPPAPQAAANQTVLDEKAASLAELSYQMAVSLGEAGIDAGLIKGRTASCVAQLDRKAYSALLGVRAAYRSGNAQSYNVAIREFEAVIGDFRSAVKGVTDRC